MALASVCGFQQNFQKATALPGSANYENLFDDAIHSSENFTLPSEFDVSLISKERKALFMLAICSNIAVSF